MQLKPFTQFRFFVPPGTHFCWAARGNVDSNLAQGFYACPVCQESNPRPLALRFSALPLSHAPYIILVYDPMNALLYISLVHLYMTQYRWFTSNRYDGTFHDGLLFINT